MGLVFRTTPDATGSEVVLSLDRLAIGMDIHLDFSSGQTQRELS